MNQSKSANITKEIVVVTGPGRSGTSLCTSILSKIGLGLTPNLVPSDKTNPSGFFEDAEVVRLNKSIISCKYGKKIFQARDYPQAYEKEISDYEDALKKYLTDALKAQNPIVIKDPRLTQLLPEWSGVCNELGIRVSYVFATRDPIAVRKSMRLAYGFKNHFAEMFWLMRCVDFFRNCPDRCFIVHYEDWFLNFDIQLSELAYFLTLSPTTNEIENSRALVDVAMSTSGYNGNLCLPESADMRLALRMNTPEEAKRLSREIFKKYSRFRSYF